MKNARRSLPIILCIVMLLCLFSACSDSVSCPAETPGDTVNEPLDTDNSPAPVPDDPVTAPDVSVPPAQVDEDSMPFAAAYTDVYEALVWIEQAREQAESGGAEVPMETIAPGDTSASDEDSGNNFSSTNIQELGVDEGDIIKTDGVNIYILNDQQLHIVSAAGTDSKVLSVTQIGESWSEADEDSSEGREKWASELYVQGDRLAVISSYSTWSERKDASGWDYDSSERTVVDIYDISDPTAPKHIAEAGQDGYPLTSRLTNDRLYLLSSYHVYGAEEDDPATYIPRLYEGENAVLISAEDILLLPENGNAYTIVTAYDLTSGEAAGNQTVLGGSGTVYMNRDNLYLACAEYVTEESAPYTESIYAVRDCKNTTCTNIIRFDVTDGVSITATGSVPGYLVDQFAMDEYEGHLRVVTTVNETSYRVFEDKDKGFVNYEWEEDRSGNSLYILNDALQVTGSVEELAPDEQVYSVRFDGEIGYFVTFRQVDPLFCADLSDPTAPVILSELKIPGFSEYLHVYSDTLLFGFGMDADEETGWTGMMKLSMFDTTDPTNVTERDTLLLEYGWSEALYDHNAMLIDTEKNIIGFPADGVYCVYGYSADRGFFERAEIDFGGWVSGTRGIYVGDFLYIIGDSMHLLDLSSYSYIAEIPFVF